MNKIIKSIAVLGGVAAVLVGVSMAYFSDTETSKDNRFVAGKIDLRFQHDGTGAWTDVDGNPIFDTQSFELLRDMKPGDKGEKTVRLWVDNNPSCGKVSVSVYEDYDNTCTSPELLNEVDCDSSPTATENNSGELNDEVQFAVWEDDCDNVLEEGEDVLLSGPLTEEHTYGMGDLPVGVDAAQCYGIAYCFGTWVGDTCDGSLVDNSSQTDSFKADLIIEALQKRNQFDQCPVGDWDEAPETGTVLDSVNIGDTSSETGHNLYDWGPVEPAASGGNWGDGTACDDGNCRVVYAPDEAGGLNNTTATFVMNFGSGFGTEKLVLRALDGISGADTFKVYVDDVLKATFDDNTDQATETWLDKEVTGLSYSGIHTIKLESTESTWSLWSTYGQVAFTYASVVAE